MSFSELKSAFETEVKAFDEARKAAETGVEVKDGNVSIPAEAYAEVTKRKKNIEELKTLLQAEGEVKDLQKFADQADPELAARFAQPLAQQKSVADALLESPEYKEMLDMDLKEMRNDVSLPFSNITEQKDVYGALGNTATSWNIGQVRQDLGYIAPLKQNKRVRDLFPAASTNSNLIEYFKSTFTNNAATVPERRAADGTSAPTGGPTDVFALKPKSTLNFTYATDQVRLIAHWIAVHRNTLADKSQMRSLINESLMYGLALEEDDQLLNGDGSGENILGLLNRPGIQTYTSAPAADTTQLDQYSDQIRRALTLVELAYLPATGVVLHPYDWEKLELQKAVTNGNYMITTNVTSGAESRIWRTPVVVTPNIAEGTFLTGAFGQATQLFDRERANIRVAEQHADFFARNAVAVLAEERLALTVTRPEGIVKGTFTEFDNTPTP